MTAAPPAGGESDHDRTGSKASESDGLGSEFGHPPIMMRGLGLNRNPGPDPAAGPGRRGHPAGTRGLRLILSLTSGPGGPAGPGPLATRRLSGLSHGIWPDGRIVTATEPYAGVTYGTRASPARIVTCLT